MAESGATQASRGHRTLWLPIPEPTSQRILDDPRVFRGTIDDWWRRRPELLPRNFPGYQLRGHRVSAKRGVPIRRVRLKNGTASSIRPSFLRPSLTARTEEVQGPLFLRQFGVPFWALARVFGATPRAWYRRDCALGRFSIGGTPVRQAELPVPLRADEPHQSREGPKLSLATTVGGGGLLGAEPAEAAGGDDLGAASGVFKTEAGDVTAQYAPQTVSTDGWKGTQAAWKGLFPRVVIRLCFLHAGLKIRDRAKPLKEGFTEVSRRVWEASHAPDRRHFGQRLRRLKQGASEQLRGIVRETVLDLGGQRPRFSLASHHGGGHRPRNLLERLMRGRNGDFDGGQDLHGSRTACRMHCRAWALFWNLAPWHPATTRKDGGWRSPAERLNQHRYHDCWLQNLLVAASLDGYRCPHLQNP